VLSDETTYEDNLPDTGIGAERERSLSAAFIKSPDYGTRSSTVIMVDYNDHVAFHERVFNPDNAGFSYQSFEYKIG
ncbi:MAG TPA: NRDE family protein, partial [Chryseosolibacter sp.]|nr:NRDE family protein [Chryseosolibacter sp.]